MAPDAHFHPELRRAARLLPRRAVGPRSIRLMRALSRLAPSLDGIEVVSLGGVAGVRMHRTRPGAGAQTPALLWIHGGGYVFGRAARDDKLCARFADTLGVTVASVDYRLAPEHPYPAALQDCYAALSWLAGRPDVDRSRLVIGGASAGGGLAAVGVAGARSPRICAGAAAAGLSDARRPQLVAD